MRLIFTLLFIISAVSFVNAQSVTPTTKATLPNELEEISGMIHLNGKLYGVEDGGNTATIYEFDSTSGAISKAVTLGVTNSDWEELTHDGTNIYVADIGNNNGTKSVLKFYKFPIQAINDIAGTTGTIPAEDIETINFTYSDYFSSRKFDCEAVFYHNGYLHLFTKDWVSSDTTVHYRLQVPTTPTASTLIAERLESFYTNDVLVTGATLMNNQILALLGYNDPAIYQAATRCSIWLLTGFTDINNIFTTATDSVKIDLGLAGTFPIANSRGQLESITAVSQTRVLLASEMSEANAIVFPQRLFGANLDEFISQELLPFGIDNFTTRLTDSEVLLTWEYNEPGAAYFEVEAASKVDGSYSYLGKVFSNPAGGTYSFTDVNFDDATIKYYRIKVVTPDGKNYYSKILPVKKDDSKLFNLVATPSPFTSGFNVSFYSDTDQVIRLSIVDMHGRAVNTRQLQTNRGRYNFTVDGLNGLSQGVYFLTARTKKDLFVRKIVKQ
ncbi:MAG: T9SS type A sorting domain-containing protein [Agriterribacter sp.]